MNCESKYIQVTANVFSNFISGQYRMTYLQSKKLALKVTKPGIFPRLPEKIKYENSPMNVLFQVLPPVITLLLNLKMRKSRDRDEDRPRKRKIQDLLPPT